MTDAERDAIYQRMRDLRLKHAGEVRPDPDLIDRDVIAGSRLAGVDVTPWIGRRSPVEKRRS